MADQLRFSKTLKSSWLVQRLQAPHNQEDHGVVLNSLSFGGGLTNGGLNETAMVLLSKLFSFDYMGSAEFEFGIVPSCFKFLAENQTDLVQGSISPVKDGPVVYYLCHKDHKDQVVERITLLATNPPQAKERVNLDCHFPKTNIPSGYLSRSAVGWLDCSNGFMFFVDKPMWEGTCKIFGVKVE